MCVCVCVCVGELVTVEAEIDQPLLLECSPVFNYSTTWRHNGVKVDEVTNTECSFYYVFYNYDNGYV